MTIAKYDAWRKEYHPMALMNEAMAEAAWIAAYKEGTSDQKPALQPVGLSDAVYTVLEGFTLPHDVRKILETAFYGPASSPPAQPAQDEIMEMARHIADTFGTRMCDENGDTHGEELYAMCIDDIVDAIKLVASHGIKE